MTRACLGAIFAALIAAPAAAQGQYPDKPVRFIVGFTAGSATDITARHVCAEIPGRLGRTGDSRECSRRGWQRRRRPGGEGRAGWQHLLLGRQRRADDQSNAAEQPDLRCGARSCAGRAASRNAEHPCRQQRRAGEKLCRLRRAGQGAAWQAVLCLAGRRHAAAHRRRDAQGPGRHRRRPRALPRGGVHRRHRRPRHDDNAKHGHDPAGGAPGPVAGACRHLARSARRSCRGCRRWRNPGCRASRRSHGSG